VLSVSTVLERAQFGLPCILSDLPVDFSCQFINRAVGSDVTLVSDGIFSCTKDITTIPVVDPRDEKRRIIFVDTPGFDHTSISDAEILKSLRDWLKKT
jgi:hypothetical protein